MEWADAEASEVYQNASDERRKRIRAGWEKDFSADYPETAESTIDSDAPDFVPGVKRGVQNLQAMTYGSGALVGGALKKMGAETAGQKLQDVGMEGYRRNIEEAGQYPKKHSFKDIYTGKTGVGGAVDWAQGTLGELVPSMVEAAGGAVIGSAVAPGPGTAVGAFAGRTVLKKGIEELVKKGIKGKTEAEARKLITRQALKKLGGRAGIAAAVMPMESGGMYGELLEEKGIDAPETALFFGALATSLEFFGGNSRLVDTFVDALSNGVGGIAKRSAKEILTNIPQEALQEGGQELFSILNTVANTDEELLTAENVERIIESMAAGAIGGGAGAVVQAGMGGQVQDPTPGKPEQDKEIDDQKVAAVPVTAPAVDPAIDPAVVDQMDEAYQDDLFMDIADTQVDVEDQSAIRTIAQRLAGLESRRRSTLEETKAAFERGEITSEEREALNEQNLIETNQQRDAEIAQREAEIQAAIAEIKQEPDPKVRQKLYADLWLQHGVRGAQQSAEAFEDFDYIQEDDIINTNGKPYKVISPLIKRLDLLENPENYEIVETNDGFVGRLIQGANPNVDTGQEAFNPFIDPDQVQSPDEASSFTDEQPDGIGETNVAPTITDKEKEVDQILDDESQPTENKPPEETAVSSTQLDVYKKSLKAAYTAGNLEIPQYMAALDLLTKKDVKSLQAIIDLLGKQNAASNDPNMQEQTKSFKARGKADLRRLIDMLGSQMYKGNMADVVIKETVQNSFDAVKASLNTRDAKGIKNGQIDVISDLYNRIVAIRDNGQGMTRKTILDAFLTIAGSDKPGQKKGDASGRYGMAKIVFLNDSEWVELNTVKNGTRYKFKAPGNEIFADKDIDITKESANKNEHGTVLIIKIPRTVEAESGSQSVWFPNDINDVSFFKQPLLHKNLEINYRESRLTEGELEYLSDPEGSAWNKENFETVAIGKNADMSKYDKPQKFNFDWGHTELHVGKERNNNRFSIKHDVLSAGVYQFEHKFEVERGKKVPYDIILNVFPTVDAKDPSYPFNMQREGWRETIREDIKSLDAYVKGISLGIEAEGTVKQFKNIQLLPRIDIDDIGTDNFDIKDFFDEAKIKNAVKKKGLSGKKVVKPTKLVVSGGQITGTIDGKKVVVADINEDADGKKIKSSFQAENDLPTAKDFLIETGIDDSQPIFHNNTTTDYFEIAKRNGYSAETFFAEFGSLMLKVKDHFIDKDIYGYSVLKDKDQSFFFGTSVDKGYHGVNLVVPFKTILVNPLAMKETTLPGITHGLYDTIVHELAHIPQRNHEKPFSEETARLKTKLASDGTDLEIRIAIGRVLKKHKNLIELLRDHYERSTTKNVGKSLDDVDDSDALASRRAADGSESSLESGDGERAGAFQAGERSTERGGVSTGTQTDGRDVNLQTTENQEAITKVSLADIQRAFPGQRVVQAGSDGSVAVFFKNGKGIVIKSMQNAGQDLIKMAIETGQMSKEGKILGVTSSNTILLDEKFADNWTLLHENKHVLDNLGMITTADNSALNAEFNKLRKSNKLEFALSTHEDSKQRMIENRANMFAQIMVNRETYRNTMFGKVIQRVMDFFQQMLGLGRQTVAGLAREVESGKIYEQTVNGQAINTTVPQAKAMREGMAMFEVREANASQRLSDAEYSKIFTEKNNLLKDLAQQARIKFTELRLLADKALGPISTRLKNVDPEISQHLRWLDFNTSQKIIDVLKTAKPLLDATKRMSPEDKSAWNWARLNSDEGKIEQIAQKYNLTDDQVALREKLNKIRAEAIEVGYDVGFIDEYWPRAIKDQEGFLQATQEISQRPVFTEAIRAQAKKLGISQEQFEREFPEAKADIISNLILGQPTGIGGPGNIQSRVFETIPEEYAKFYMDADAALMQYVYSMTKRIESRKFFGKVPKRINDLKSASKRKNAELLKYEQLADMARAENPEKIADYENQIQNLTDDLTIIDEKLNAYKMQRDYTENIGAYIDRLRVDEKIEKKDEKMVRDILDARFHERGTHGIVGAYKNLSYIDTMGSPLSAITQIGDLAWAMYVGKVWTPKGFSDTVQNFTKALFKKSDITKEDLGIERIAQEFADGTTLSRAVSKVFKLVGLEKIDSIGKEVLINNALAQYKAEAKADPEALAKSIKPTFGNKSADVVQEILADNPSDNVKMLLYSRLLDFQPLSLSEMPEYYLNSGNGRIFYMLKTYTMKQFDVFRKEVVHNLKSENPQQKIEGIRNMVQLMALLTLANATADEIKDFMLGRETRFSDNVIENFLTLGGASRYLKMQVSREGFGSALAQQILPPMKFVNSASKDIIEGYKNQVSGDTANFDHARIIDSIPGLGKLYYWHAGRGAENKKSLAENDFKKVSKDSRLFKKQLGNADDKRLFIESNFDRFKQMKLQENFQSSLNKNKAVINKLEKIPSTANVQTRLGQLKAQREQILQRYFEVAEEMQ